MHFLVSLVWCLRCLSLLILYAVHADVHHIYADELDSVLLSSRLVLLTLYAPWCNHCRIVLPIMERVALKVENSSIDAKIVMIDMSISENHDLFDSLPIFGYPSILLFKDGELVEGYSGARTEKYKIFSQFAVLMKIIFRSIMKYLGSYDDLIKNQWEPSPYIAKSTDIATYLLEDLDDAPMNDGRYRILGLGLFPSQNKIKAVRNI